MNRTFILTSALFIGVLVSFFLAMMIGVEHYSFTTVLHSLLNSSTPDNVTQTLVEIRLPRVLVAFVVGMMISVAGLIMQTVTHNDLSEPSILGINAGANLMIVLMVVIVPTVSFIGIIFSGFIGGAAVGIIILMMTKYNSPVKLVLAGAGISLLLYALTNFIVITNGLGQFAMFFTSGGAAGQSLANILTVIPIALLLIGALVMMSRELDILMLNDEVARSIGQNQRIYKFATLFIAILLAAISVALVGNIIFLGMLVPHIVKMLIGYSHQKTIIFTAILGGVFFVLADMFARMFSEMPVNAVISMIGLPFFIYVIRKRGHRYA